MMARPTFLAYAVVSIQTFVRLELLISMWPSLSELESTLRAVFYSVLRLQMAPLLTNLFSSSAADARLKHYLREGEIGRAVSLHSFRSGCAITLALSGTELQDIMGHVGWHNRSTAAYYMQFSKVMSAGSPSSVLTGRPVNIEDPGIFYDQYNNLRRFTPAFPR